MREITRDREKQTKETTTTRERERELGIFSMIRFASSTSSFLALLVIKPYRKKRKCKIQKFPHFAVKMFKPLFVSVKNSEKDKKIQKL